MNGTVKVDNSPTTLQNALPHRLQELRRIGIFPFVAGIREPFADIALPCRSQQCVDHRVQQYIRVTVPVESKVGVCEMDSADDEGAPCNRAMCIVAFADA